ncbi:hypothetical protein LSH36_225g02029 [Paralvinella palmiformis]|uniref:G-protein coupled receptors family 1 profile domain-containing protein n=1 Tax=Paralvinella palmiformis TaxID=53620 RepID=A0AAD9JP02_9ANNE|nr:hypothetical protein LSH36_225g02029 [Paralvinella palmiformis]
MSMLMINLAVVDTLLLIVWTTMMALPALCDFRGGCAFYDRVKPALSAYGWPLGSTFHMQATWSIVAITFSRFVSVCWASRSNQVDSRLRVKGRLLMMHVLCILFNVPRFCEKYISFDPEGHMISPNTRLGASSVYAYLYQVFLYYLVIYVIPLSLLTYFTARLCISLRAARKRREALTAKARDNNDLTFSLVIVVVVFIVCQLVNPIRRLLAAVYVDRDLGCGSVYLYYRSWVATLVNFNSACNFFIFCLCSPGFRRRLKRILYDRAKVGAIGSEGQRVNKSHTTKTTSVGTT